MPDRSQEEDTFEFVDEPDSDYFCPVCQDLLTEPFQLECGHQLCRICRDRLLSSNKTECPTCRASDALSNARFDKFLERKVSSVKIHCQHHKQACEWVGEVGDLQYHLDHNEVACPFWCGKRSCQAVIKKHKSLYCLNRLIGCENCDYYNTFAIVTEKHNPICLQSSVDCPNHCPAKGLKRSQLEQHFNECSHQLVNCPKTGCSVWLSRGEMGLHKVHIEQHNLVMVETSQAAAISPAFRYLHNQPPIEFVIPNFQGMKDANAKWKSPLLFTHEKGYKFHLEVYPNGWGSGQDTHVSVSLIGGYDSDVALILERDVVIELINWRADKNHLIATVNFSRNSNHNGSASCSSSSSFENAPGAPGTPHFISYSSLCHPGKNIEYLQDDCLRLRVVDIAVYSTPLLSKTPSWQDPHTATQSVCEFTLTEFTKRKQFNNVYTSLPFYSHPHGYKLCLKVYVNGHGESKGTHIRIGAVLMKGDFDSDLQWPFQGEIIIELLNCRENDHHYRGDTIYFNRYNDPDDSAASRVTKGTYALMGCHRNHFISHSSLLYNPDTNTEYLQDDYLRLRVVYVTVYSTPLLSKMPSWQDPHTATQSVCEFTLTEFTKRKQFNNAYFSPPFHTHPNGYKMCIKVYANGSGDGKGTHISIFAILMKGDYDNNLQWPFEGDIVIELLNWRENSNHYCEDTIQLNESCGSTTSRVTEGEYAPMMSGKSSFITHSSLLYNPDTNTEYLQDDCLHLRVVDVAVYSTPLLLKTPSWQDPHTATQSVCEFTLSEFTKRKQFNNAYFSPPFYTHPNGYKMCIKVYANGSGDGKGTHISIFASLMKGDYDNNLQWPFEGDIVIELLNWRENSNHYCEDTIQLNESCGSTTSRVTEGEYAPMMSGKSSFITHSSLLYNPDTNTEYLQDDCLHLRVVDVAVYSTPLLLKTPSWQDPHTATQSVCEFTLSEFTKRKQFNNAYFSPPFYTHPNGYKMCIKVYANGSGDGKGTHISIFASLMKGDYDNNLQWPFEGDIVIELLNWRENSNHYCEDTIQLNESCGSTTSRVTEGEYAPMMSGKSSFITHSSLLYNPDTNTEYLQDDCLRLRVVDAAVYSTPILLKTPSWQVPHTATQSVCEFTLTEFTKRKQFKNEYYSPPFYSHPNGYKLCLRVDANGDGKGNGTHISIFARVMKGDYDNNLQWPFEGEIIVNLLNWREDNRHYQGGIIKLKIHNDSDCSTTSRVTEGEYAPKLRGIFCFISHSSLLHNPDTNTKYLQDDCLRLRVVDIAVYSTPLFLKTPSWQDPHTATQSVCEFTLTEFTKRKQLENAYVSIPFYSHPQGYKLCLSVFANGFSNGKGTHISIIVGLMRGKYDDNLQWPLKGRIVVEVLNWRKNSNHYRVNVISLGKSCATEEDFALISAIFRFIPHSSLLYNPDTNTEYLQDDCLRMRVVDVAVYSTPLLLKTPSWQDPLTANQSVCEFTLTEFTKRKQSNNVFYCPPFYSHPNGYKLCLRVDANGNCKGKGTHISIYATLMRGDYDNNLQWPFEGDVLVKILNWRYDRHHYRGDTMSINRHGDLNGHITSRVTDGKYASNSWANFCFISHSSLLYNPDANTEYLLDDCLRLRVVDVAVYSTPLLLKIPSWQGSHTATQSVCEFTLTEFTKRKQFDNMYFGPPFYTHCHGYKMLLVLYANGRGTAKDTHVSVCVTIIIGEYDSGLNWPFEGAIIVELINWRVDKNHLSHTIFFDDHTDPKFSSRVTDDSGSYERHGSDDVFPHSSLSFNPVTNTEYLQDDCLRFRVRKVHVCK